MTEQVVPLAWRWTAETSSDGAHRFCRIRVTAPPGEIGDPNAWAVVGLVQGAIDDMLKQLALQPVLRTAAGLGAATLFADLHAWHSEGLRPDFAAAGAHPHSYVAVPEATELFDAEEAYLVRSGAAGARLLWRDCATKEVRDVAVDFDAWLAGWRAVRDAIGQDGRAVIECGDQADRPARRYARQDPGEHVRFVAYLSELQLVAEADEVDEVGRVLTDPDRSMAQAAVLRHLDRRAADLHLGPDYEQWAQALAQGVIDHPFLTRRLEEWSLLRAITLQLPWHSDDLLAASNWLQLNAAAVESSTEATELLAERGRTKRIRSTASASLKQRGNH